MNEAPPGWRQGVLGDVTTLVRNGIFARRPTDDRSGVPILRISAVRDARLNIEAVKYVAGVDSATIATYSIRADDLLFTRYNGSRHLVGRCARVPQHTGPILHPDKLIRVVPNHQIIDSRFLAMLMESSMVRDFLDPRIKTTAGQSGITGPDVRQIPVAYPDLADQRRIADILEDHLSRLDAAHEGCNNAIDRVLALRISLLSKAFLGERDWPSARLIDLLDVSVGGLWGSAPGVDEVDVRVVRVTELSRDGELDPSTAATRSVTERQLSSRRLAPGDLLLEKSGGGPNTPVGRVGLVRKLDGDSICSNFMQLLRPREYIIPRFLHLYLSAFYLRGQTIPMQAASTNIRNIKASEYVEMLVPIPDRATQIATVARLEADLSASNRLTVEMRRGIDRSVSLRHAVLDAAFSGRLTGLSRDMDLVEETANV